MRQARRGYTQHSRPEGMMGMPRQRRDTSHRPRARGVGFKSGLSVIAFAIVIMPGTIWAGACDDKVGETVQVTGRYVAAGQAYAQAFVFAMVLDCHGTPEVVTVQRSTGNFPVCSPDQSVEVVGKLVWNRALVDGHYEINNPSRVACVSTVQAESKAAPQAPSPAPAVPPAPPPTSEPRRAEVKGVASSVWVGRYQDSRGAGELTVSLVRGTSTVSGTWRVRTGGGGPLVGTLEGDGRRLQFRLENLAPECPGTFQGVADLGSTTLVGTYNGQDCEGPVTDGRLDLRVQ